MVDAASDTMCVVTFNVELGQRPDSAIAALRAASLPRALDILLLQEVDDSAAQRIARALDMGYVYYPAIFRNRSGKDFGNAVLSRWAIVDDAKIILPHRSWYGRSQRIATAATIHAGAITVRVYSTHLGTPADVTPGQRRDQLRAIVADATRYEHVIVGGDFNGSKTPRVAEQAGYVWATRGGPKTTAMGRWDHILFKGMMRPDTLASGTVTDGHGTGDHLAVWAVGVPKRSTE